MLRGFFANLIFCQFSPLLLECWAEIILIPFHSVTNMTLVTASWSVACYFVVSKTSQVKISLQRHKWLAKRSVIRKVSIECIWSGSIPGLARIILLPQPTPNVSTLPFSESEARFMVVLITRSTGSLTFQVIIRNEKAVGAWQTRIFYNQHRTKSTRNWP